MVLMLNILVFVRVRGTQFLETATSELHSFAKRARMATHANPPTELHTPEQQRQGPCTTCPDGSEH